LRHHFAKQEVEEERKKERKKEYLLQWGHGWSALKFQSISEGEKGAVTRITSKEN